MDIIEKYYQQMLDVLKRDLNIQKCKELLEKGSQTILNLVDNGKNVLTEETNSGVETLSESTKICKKNLLSFYEKFKLKIDDLVEDTIIKKYGIRPQEIILKEPTKEELVIKGIFHQRFVDILHAVKTKTPLLLVGPPGSGKSYTCRQVAESLKLDFYLANAVTQEYDLKGFIDARGEYQETEFYRAFTKGGIFLLDELDASSPEVLVLINNAIANREFPFPNGKVKAHEDFRVVATANTFGQGEDYQFVGRNALDAATLDRFAVVYFEYDTRVEKSLVHDLEIYYFVLAIRKAVDVLQLRQCITMRASMYISTLIQSGQDIKSVINENIIKGISTDDLVGIVALVSNTDFDRNNKYYQAFLEIVDTKSK